MKKILTKIQDLGQKAAQIKKAIESAPAKAAEIREAVVLTTGQLQQLRADVQATVARLRADNEEQLIQSLQEINAHAKVFRQAGFQLGGVDLDLSINRRLIAHLEKVEDVSQALLRSLLAANATRKVSHALLSAILKAEELADKVDLTNLSYHKLVVDISLTPSLRLCWRAHTAEAAPASTAPSGVVAPPATAPLAPPATSLFGEGSFFERRAPVPAPAAQSASASTSAEAPAATQAAAQVSASPAQAAAPALGSIEGDWRRDALSRFKKMPDLSKHRR